jgi:hypothetical protein
LYQGTALQPAEKDLEGGARLYSLRKKTLKEGHGFTACRKMLFLKGTAFRPYITAFK